MSFSTHPHPCYCGIDLHARSMYVCIVSQDGAILVHRHRQAAPEPFRKAVAPSRDGLVVAGACLCTWYWLADLWADPGMPLVLGHALSMNAIHGGQATNATIAAHKLAARLRGGMLPKASVSPAQMRATRALLRRRTPLMRQCAELFSHVQTTPSQSHLAAMGTKIADQATREGVAARCAAPAVHKHLEGDLALMTSDDEVLRELELALLHTAKKHEAHPLSLVPTGPGLGKLLSLVLLYAIHRSARFPRGQACAASCRLVPCSQESGGKPVSPSGKTSGHAPLQWALSEAAALCLRTNAAGPKYLARLEQKHDQGTALSLLAHPWGRAVSSRLKRPTACDLDLFLRPSRSRAGGA